MQVQSGPAALPADTGNGQGVDAMSATPDDAATEHTIHERAHAWEPDGRAAAARPLARLFMTSDLRAATGLTRTHLDFYLREGLITPIARTESGYLLFGDTELA